MFSAFCNNFEDAKRKGLASLILSGGDLGWTPVVHQKISIDVNKVLTEKKEEIVDLTENWLLKTIVDNKDTKLFNASKKYLPKHSQLFINDKIQCKK